MKRIMALLLSIIAVLSVGQISVAAAPKAQIATLNQASTTVPQVKGVKAAAGANAVTLSWNKVSGKSITYTVYQYSKSTKKYTKKGTTTSKKFTVKKLKNSTSYCFAVKAYDKSGKKAVGGKMSAIVTVKTTKPVKVAKLSGVKITTAGKGKYLKLSWSAQKGVTGYQVYRSTSGKTGSYKKLVTLKSDKLSYADTKLKNSTPYYYAVRAYKKTPDGYTYGSFAKVNLSTKLTKAYLQKKIEKMNDLYLGWLVHGYEAAESFDKKDSVTRWTEESGTNKYYRIKSKRFKSVKQIRSAAATCFDKKFYERYIDSYYFDKNGKLYGLEYLGQGGDFGADILTIKNIKCSDKKCTYTVFEQSSEMSDYSNSKDCVLYYSNGNWIYKASSKDYPYANFAMYFGDITWK